MFLRHYGVCRIYDCYRVAVTHCGTIYRHFRGRTSHTNDLEEKRRRHREKERKEGRERDARTDGQEQGVGETEEPKEEEKQEMKRLERAPF